MPSRSIKTVLVLWCLAEILVFALFVHLFGLGWTLLAEVVIGGGGLVLLKRRGSAALVRLRATFRGRTAGTGPAGPGSMDEGLVGEGLAVLGALALLLPGFLSDVLGLVLIVRPLRARVAAWIGAGGIRILRGGRGAGGPAVVDLQPGEWRSGGDAPGTPRLRR